MAHLRMSDSETGYETVSGPQTPFSCSISGVTRVSISVTVLLSYGQLSLTLLGPPSSGSSAQPRLTQQGPEPVELLAELAEERLLGYGVLVVQVRVVFPGEPDPAVQRDGRGRRLHVRRRDHHPRYGGRDGEA